MMGTWYATCITIGLLVGLLISILIIKMVNKNGKAKTEYDEMQEIERGKGYKYGFWTMCAVAGFWGCLSLFDIELPFDTFTLFLMTIIIGAGVQAIYCIMKDAYIGLNTNKVRIGIVTLFIGLFNLVNAAIFIIKGNFYVDGKFGASFSNLMCGLMILAIGIAFLIKNAIDKKEGSVDEES